MSYDFENAKYALSSGPFSDDDELISTLNSFSNISKFEEPSWYLDRLSKGSFEKRGEYTLYFNGSSDNFMWYVKMFSLIRLNERCGVRTVQSNIYGAKYFLNYLLDDFPNTSLSGINKEIILEFEIFLRKDKRYAKATKESIWTGVSSFLRSIQGLQGVACAIIPRLYNPFMRTTSDRLIDSKYIPLEVIKQYDEIFYKDNSLSLAFKIAYWICRLIPSRINEVLSIPIDCLKHFHDDIYTLTLHNFKQNGGYLQPELRLIQIKYSDMGKYLVDLILEQQKISSALVMNNKTIDNFLFAYIPKKPKEPKKPKKPMSAEEIEKYTGHLKVCYFRDFTFIRMINLLAKKHQIHDSNGDLYRITSHQLRHNAITDRIYSGFTLLEIKEMSHHKSTTMLSQSYVHPQKEMLQKVAKSVEASKLDNSDAPSQTVVLFKGRLINTDNKILVDRIMSKPRSHSLGRLGICSDISGCESKIFECFKCNYFIPNADEIEYYEEQFEEWKHKRDNSINKPFLFDNAQHNMNLVEAVILKIRNSIKDVNKIEES
ncbi:MAG: tyrosine-type recombinase/integrase [Clostridiaceae bacterium]